MSLTARSPDRAPFFRPALSVGARGLYLLNAHGEILDIPFARAASQIGQIAGETTTPLLVCHLPYTRQKARAALPAAFDLLELYAFVHPTRFATPTPAGIAKALGLSVPEEPEDMPHLMISCVRALLDDLARAEKKDKLLDLAGAMGMNGHGWLWTPDVYDALGAVWDTSVIHNSSRSRLNVWSDLAEWADDPPPPPPARFGISGEETRARLENILLHRRGAQTRPEQANYATRLAEGFDPVTEPDQPHVVLAEAGTGIGKTIGYLAPAMLWSEKNEGSVLISTYTRNLQRQIGEEMKRLYPDKAVRDRHVTIRKGRENYLCLLNLEDLAASVATTRSVGIAVSAGLMARWVMETEDGDLTGAGFHGWLPGLMGISTTLSLADRRGECVFSACDHYRRCFGEHAVRKSVRTPIVIANHAIVMIKASHGDEDLARHIIFDEGHHIFDAADGTFCAELTGVEMYDLRLWLVGPEGGRKSRARGLKKRLADLLDNDSSAIKLMEDTIHRASFLPHFEWLKRIQSGGAQGSAEEFLATVITQVEAGTSAQERESAYSLEVTAHPLSPSCASPAAHLHDDLKSLRQPMQRLAARLRQKLVEETDTLSTDTRKRLEMTAESIDRRVRTMISPWISLIENLLDGTPAPEFVDWMEIARVDTNILDVGVHRHYIDPTEPLARSLKSHANTLIVTSATLRDGGRTGSAEDWEAAEILTGARHISHSPIRFSIASPYRYADQTRVFIATDIDKADMDQLASATKSLFASSKGGALGIFTSIARLRAVHKRIAAPLGEDGIPLYAQHVDGIDTGTLIDMFRDDPHSCLLGTDAVRDGMDVPGDSLRLIVFDRVPWPRRTILHRERRAQMGGNAFDDRLTRLRLKQAYGRLVRTPTDRGIFVMLDNALPTRLLDAFPDGVRPERLGIADIIARSKDFFKDG